MRSREEAVGERLPSGQHLIPPLGLLARITSDAVLAQAHAWVCRQRREYSPKCDVWDQRWRWDEVRPRLQRELLACTFRFGAVRHRCIREEWTFRRGMSRGCPVSPLFGGLYLNELDERMAELMTRLYADGALEQGVADAL